MFFIKQQLYRDGYTESSYVNGMRELVVYVIDGDYYHITWSISGSRIYYYQAYLEDNKSSMLSYHRKLALWSIGRQVETIGSLKDKLGFKFLKLTLYLNKLMGV